MGGVISYAISWFAFLQTLAFGKWAHVKFYSYSKIIDNTLHHVLNWKFVGPNLVEYGIFFEPSPLCQGSKLIF